MTKYSKRFDLGLSNSVPICVVAVEDTILIPDLGMNKSMNSCLLFNELTENLLQYRKIMSAAQASTMQSKTCPMAADLRTKWSSSSRSKS